jgi:hypothetical protein
MPIGTLTMPVSGRIGGALRGSDDRAQALASDPTQLVEFVGDALRRLAKPLECCEALRTRDSPLEESGFEPSVPAMKTAAVRRPGPPHELRSFGSASGMNVERNQKFESTSLQQRVRDEPAKFCEKAHASAAGRTKALTPAGTRGVLNDAISIYFADATLAGAFVARWCIGAKVETAGGVFQVRGDAPVPRIGAGLHRTS